MSVYTPVTLSEVHSLLECYTIGQAIELTPITAGLENTNYFLTTKIDSKGTVEEKQWVLTLVEFHPETTVNFVARLTAQLAKIGLAVAAPVIRSDGLLYAKFKNKPCMIVPRIIGQQVDIVDEKHCQAVGYFLARMHQATLMTVVPDGIHRDYKEWQGQLHSLTSTLSAQNFYLSEQHLRVAQQTINKFFSLPLNELPLSAIHGDLFIDNVLFLNQSLAGVLDFYHATIDFCIYDLAIAINDWCRDSQADSGLNLSLVKELVSAYQQERLLTQEEMNALPIMLEAAAMRFWISRILTLQWQAKQQASHLSQKDPNERWSLLYQLSQVEIFSDIFSQKE